MLDSAALSRVQALTLYRRRWDVEVFFRTVKQTLERRTMRCGSPAAAHQELRWTMIGAAIAGTLSVRALLAAKVNVDRRSSAGVIRIIREAMSVLPGRPPKPSLKTLNARLSAAVIDDYVRKRPRTRIEWPTKRKRHPPGPPKLITANDAETLQIKRFLDQNRKELLTA